ncbi:LysR family transcriptional regulator [Cohnella xylanilytica]|uniref:LysR family transcriptional regulator n=1 Tax=Cohnella xylanilytica TaxID=557555 RepID=UPI001B24E017|nr:LysR family transcriptional regulator [Cohnella xylanilytica]GIO15753.1 LysR family transcriptional regulator [Cohnella xylanilytica]
MELLQLHYFRTVARLEHMTRASQELRIAQPALSKTISRLEEDLGVPLFDRQNRQIKLNPFGKAFLRKVETALSALEEGKREVADLAGTERGVIRLATTTLSRLSGSLAAFRELHPDVNFRIVQISPAAEDEMVRLLEEGEVDLGFTAASLGREGIGEIPVLKAEICLAVPKGHRLEGRESIRLEEAAGEPFVEYKEGHPFRKINEEFSRRAGLERNVVCEIEEPAALESLVLAGLGVAFVPACPGDEKSRLSLVRIAAPVCSREFTVAWLEKRYLSQAAREFKRFLGEYFAKLGMPAAEAAPVGASFR